MLLWDMVRTSGLEHKHMFLTFDVGLLKHSITCQLKKGIRLSPSNTSSMSERVHEVIVNVFPVHIRNAYTFLPSRWQASSIRLQLG